jgi:hypothetical protein
LIVEHFAKAGFKRSTWKKNKSKEWKERNCEFSLIKVNENRGREKK